MAGHMQKAEKAMQQISKLKSAPPSLLKVVERHSEQAPKFKTVVEFET